MSPAATRFAALVALLLLAGAAMSPFRAAETAGTRATPTRPLLAPTLPVTRMAGADFVATVDLAKLLGQIGRAHV